MLQPRLRLRPKKRKRRSNIVISKRPWFWHHHTRTRTTPSERDSFIFFQRSLTISWSHRSFVSFFSKQEATYLFQPQLSSLSCLCFSLDKKTHLNAKVRCTKKSTDTTTDIQVWLILSYIHCRHNHPTLEPTPESFIIRVSWKLTFSFKDVCQQEYPPLFSSKLNALLDNLHHVKRIKDGSCLITNTAQTATTHSYFYPIVHFLGFFEM